MKLINVNAFFFVVGVGVGETTVVLNNYENQPKEVHAQQVSSYFGILLLNHDQGKQEYFRTAFATHKVTGNFLTCLKPDFNSSSVGTAKS